MHLESLTIKNYRKFHSIDNKIYFVHPETIDITKGEKQPKSVIASSTTLIIGKNNTGKTTVANALNMLYQNKQPSASDFNLSYLNALFLQYKNAFEADETTSFESLETPNLEFTLMLKVNFYNKDLMTHLSPFIPISEKGNEKPVSVNVTIKLILIEESSFKEEVNNIFQKNIETGNNLFEKFYALLSKETSSIRADSNGNLYKFLFIDLLGDIAKKFNLKKIINIKEIKANRHLKEGVLSDVFNKIVAFQFSSDDKSRSNLEGGIKSINHQISKNVKPKSSDISQVLNEVESTERIDLNLSGNVTYDNIIRGLIKYNFMDGDDHIPEDQFGLGYINLLNIIGEIIYFVDSYEDKSHFSQINLLFIEEPEAFMHPQMQEFFIKRIDNTVRKALEIANKSSEIKKILQCQIAITTHSAHIVNSKIHSSNTFNNINYLTSIEGCTKATNLTDDAIVSREDTEAKEKLNFIKKHIKYKVSELFFSDAVIFVEGITEETLLNYYLEKHQILSNYYISVFNINGAHGKLYLPLAKKLSVPSLIVTDLDIKRAKCEKHEKHKKSESCEICGQKAETSDTPCVLGLGQSYIQITSLDGRRTTNATIKEFNQQIREKSKDEADKLDDIEFFEDDNLYVVFQKDPIKEQYATSLEEALILTNYENDIVNTTIEKCKKKRYWEILNDGDKKSRENLIHKSFELQRRLSDSKSKFSNELLFNILKSEEEDQIPKLPNYLEDGLNWLVDKLKPKEEHSPSSTKGSDTQTETAVAENTEVISDDSK